MGNKAVENDVLVINPVKKSKSAPSIKQVQKNDNSEISKVIQQTKVYTEDDHLQGKPDYTIELYEIFKTAILNLGNDLDIKLKNKKLALFRKEKCLPMFAFLKTV
jgi:hypothetical protein